MRLMKKSSIELCTENVGKTRFLEPGLRQSTNEDGVVEKFDPNLTWFIQSSYLNH